MRLIIFSYDFPPSTGGIARLCQEIAEGMKAYYSDVLVLTREFQGAVPYNGSGTKLVKFTNRRVHFEWQALKFLNSIKDKEKVTILCGTWHPEAAIALLAGFKNVFILGHGTEFLPGKSFIRKFFWLPIYASFVLKKCKLVICNSRYTESLVKSISSRSNVVALPLGVNENFFKPSYKENDSDHLNICTISRIEKFKGHDFIANVISKLPKHICEFVIWRIAGTGPDLEYLKNHIAELQLEENVLFEGFISDENLPHFYGKSDLFILCSRENSRNIQVEGFGLVFLEAQSSGIPVIGTKTGGIPDAVKEGQGGWLIDQDNEQQLLNLILSFFSDRNLLKEMGKKARLRVEEEATWRIYNAKLAQYLVTNVK